MLGQSSWNVSTGETVANAATTISPRGRPAISRAGKVAAREPAIGEVMGIVFRSAVGPAEPAPHVDR